MGKFSKQTGFSLIELLVALLLSSVLIMGFSMAYSSISGLVQSGKNLENKQEVLRASLEVFSRSIKQTDEVVTVAGSTLSLKQKANSIACDGTIPNADYTEIYTLNGNTLQCNIGDGEKRILIGVESINFSQARLIISIKITPVALSGETADEVTIDIALSAIIMKKAME